MVYNYIHDFFIIKVELEDSSSMLRYDRLIEFLSQEKDRIKCRDSSYGQRLLQDAMQQIPCQTKTDGETIFHQHSDLNEVKYIASESCLDI